MFPFSVFFFFCLIPADNLKATLSSKAFSPSRLSPHSDTDSVFLSSPVTPALNPPDLEASPEISEAAESCVAPTPEPCLPQKSETNDVDHKVPRSVCINSLFNYCSCVNI